MGGKIAVITSITRETAASRRSRRRPKSNSNSLVNVHFKGPLFLTQRLLPMIVGGEADIPDPRPNVRF